MALINCPNCGKDISDKAILCPSCGFELKKDKGSSKNTITKCVECGNDLPFNADICPNCGCPVKKTKVSIFKKKSFWITTVSFILVICCSIGGLLFYQEKQNEEKNARIAKQKKAQQAKQIKLEKEIDYYHNLKDACDTMQEGISLAETACNSIHDVWYNSIFDIKDSDTLQYTKGAYDFDTALQNLYSDSKFSKKIEAIEDNQDSVKTYMQQLPNPPAKYKETYSDIKDLYDSYLNYTNLAIDPSGSLTTYTSNINDAKISTDSDYQKVCTDLEAY